MSCRRRGARAASRTVRCISGVARSLLSKSTGWSGGHDDRMHHRWPSARHRRLAAGATCQLHHHCSGRLFALPTVLLGAFAGAGGAGWRGVAGWCDWRFLSPRAASLSRVRQACWCMRPRSQARRKTDLARRLASWLGEAAAAHLGVPDRRELPAQPSAENPAGGAPAQPGGVRRDPGRRPGRRRLPGTRGCGARAGGAAVLHPGNAAVPGTRRADRVRAQRRLRALLGRRGLDPGDDACLRIANGWSGRGTASARS